MEDLQNIRGAINRSNKQLSFLASLRDCYKLLDTSGEAVRPLNMIVVMIWVEGIEFEAMFSAV